MLHAGHRMLEKTRDRRSKTPKGRGRKRQCSCNSNAGDSQQRPQQNNSDSDKYLNVTYGRAADEATRAGAGGAADSAPCPCRAC